MTEKKQQVIDTARELFSEYGYRKVSMNDLALKSGVTKKTIYSYFKDKDALFEYFILEQISAMKEIVEKIEKKELSFFDSVKEGLYELLKYRKEQKFLNIISQEAELYHVTPVVRFIKMVDDSILNYIKEKLELAMERGDIKKVDIDICAFVIYRIYMAILLEWDSKKHPIDEKKLTNEISDILKSGLICT